MCVYTHTYTHIYIYVCVYTHTPGFPGGTSGKEDTCQCRDLRDVGLIPGWGKIPWKRTWLTHSRILAWRTSCTEEPGGLQSIGSQRVGHD